MPKRYKILIIGFGSIGQRHYRNLLNLGYKNVYIFDNDKKKIKDYRLKISDLRLAELKKFDIAFVCSPNHLHIKHAFLAAKAGCHTFIEKPLSHKLKDVDKLVKFCRQKKLVNMVACNIRFHPAYVFIKDYLAKKRLGKIYTISLSCGYFLPYWRNIDYRKSYASKRSTGGGIILDDIHEFDLLFWLNDFETVTEAKIFSDHVSPLQIETEDIAVGVFRFKNKVLGVVKSDYLNQWYTRRCRIVGSKGTLEWDWQENKVWLLTRTGKRPIFQVKNYDLNNFYMEQMKYFLTCVLKRRKTFNDVKRAAKILTVILRRKL